MPVEAADILRRSAASGEVSRDVAALAHAELLDAPLATLDARLARASGPRCEFRLPPA